MYLLHVVAISGGNGWTTGCVLWLLTALFGGLFAFLSGEWSQPGALLIDLALAGGGAAAGNLIARPVGTDLLAYLYGVRVLCTALGSFLALFVAHDLVHYLAPEDPQTGRHQAVISDVGGFQFLYTWLSGWPSEAGLVEAEYDGGLWVKLLPDALHYQVHAGPFTGSETLLIEPGTRAAAEEGTLAVSVPASDATAARSARLENLRPPGRSQELQRQIECLAEARARAVAPTT
ncbi:MAG TPA: hypothetical protein VFA70_14405 [Dehalococcoidia bacterium]|nr:hypothetical protein [Dehalococcoidia bacterium]